MNRKVSPKMIEIYADAQGYEPFTKWLDGLQDVLGRKRILTRIRRVEQGNYGDCEPVGDKIFELRMFFGPGYRVYFAEKDKLIVILLCGGDKSSQEEDIKTAKSYWKEFLENA